MSAASTSFSLPIGADQNVLSHGHDEAESAASGGAAPKRILVGYGFWIFLLSDIIMFSAFFAAYAVLADATAEGPSAAQLFSLKNAGIETVCLLFSSFTCGLAAIATSVRNALWTYVGLLVTGLLGAVFLALELTEFTDMITHGNGPQHSAFLSAFFALVGCHGLHVTAGILWDGTMLAQIFAKGFRADIMRRLLCFSLFWHALDIIWIAVLTIVYLMGVAK
jgi:cytochrome o ubiquinol oxidase subunit 3